MEDKKSRYTPAQAKSFKKYISGKARIELVTTPEYKNHIIETAKASGLSVNAFMLKAVEDKMQNIADELPPQIVPNAITWLQSHGHSDQEISDFLNSIATK